jgi:hypothetical protein
VSASLGARGRGRARYASLLALLILLSCRASTGGKLPHPEESGEVPVDSGPPLDSLPPWKEKETGETPPPDEVPSAGIETSEQVFRDEGVLVFAIEASLDALDALDADPDTWVPGSFRYGRRAWDVGLRLKGHSSFQGLDGKPAWKIRFDLYDEDARFYGLKRLTLDNNVWDPSSMSETLGYLFFREAGSPAPRTGYATLSLNGEALGLYTIVESMDDRFMERWWPGREGGLYEMTRTCDFTSDCSCFEAQDRRGDYDPASLAEVCLAVRRGDVDLLPTVFDWDHLLRFFAAERVVNHPDSYTYNLNNYFFYHDPEARVSLSPWGGDSMFVYWYPPADLSHPCVPMPAYDNLARGAYGYVARLCEASSSCRAELAAVMLEQADLLESLDLAGRVIETAERIRPFVYEETRNANWRPEHFEYAHTCFAEWLAGRPGQVRRFAEAWGAIPP